jgi:hypothetical protein
MQVSAECTMATTEVLYIYITMKVYEVLYIYITMKVLAYWRSACRYQLSVNMPARRC